MFRQHVPDAAAQFTVAGFVLVAARLRVAIRLLDFLLDRLGQLRDGRVQAIQQLQQVASSPTGSVFGCSPDSSTIFSFYNSLTIPVLAARPEILIPMSANARSLAAIICRLDKYVPEVT